MSSGSDEADIESPNTARREVQFSRGLIDFKSNRTIYSKGDPDSSPLTTARNRSSPEARILAPDQKVPVSIGNPHEG
jgi:hypothetical protein